jgi:hypothetical protein
LESPVWVLAGGPASLAAADEPTFDRISLIFLIALSPVPYLPGMKIQ